jgi:hypothetical protein
MHLCLAARLFVSPSLWLAGLLTLLAAVPACAVDLYCFRDAFGRVLASTVADTKPVPATVTQAAVDWARRYYSLDNLDVLAVEFNTRPARFWRVTFLAWQGGHRVHLYAVVLPDGRPVEPTARDET